VYDAVVLCIHFAVVCIVVCRTVVPPFVHFDASSCCDHVECVDVAVLVDALCSSVCRCAPPTGAANRACLTF
jgi:hypothetical protein